MIYGPVITWINNIINLIGTYVSWLFSLNYGGPLNVGSTIVYFAIINLVIIFIKRLAGAGAYHSPSNKNNEPDIPV